MNNKIKDIIINPLIDHINSMIIIRIPPRRLNPAGSTAINTDTTRPTPKAHKIISSTFLELFLRNTNLRIKNKSDKNINITHNPIKTFCKISILSNILNLINRLHLNHSIRKQYADNSTYCHKSSLKTIDIDCFHDSKNYLYLIISTLIDSIYGGGGGGNRARVDNLQII